MTDNEIIKALKCCRCTTIKDCGSCPFYCFNNCTSNLATETLDLINRQKAEIERLEKTAFDKGLDLSVIYKIAKDKAIKDFAKQVKMELCYEFGGLLPSSIADRIDNLVKEMLGEQEWVHSTNE